MNTTSITPQLAYKNLGQRHIQHALAVLPKVIAIHLAEVPPQYAPSVLRSAAQLRQQVSLVPIPSTALIPQDSTLDTVAHVVNGLSATSLALSQGAPTDSVARVLQRAAAISTGRPMTGDPVAPSSDPLLAQVASTVATSCPELAQDDPEFARAAEEVRAWYDCHVHSRYLGGSVLDGIRGIAQEIAGVFSTKKDLQGDYTRALYRYNRDQSDERAQALYKAAATLVSYLQTNYPDDDLLSDSELVGYAKLYSGSTEDISDRIEDAKDRADDTSDMEGGSGSGANEQKQKEESGSGGDGGRGRDAVSGISHTEDIPETVAILKHLASTSSLRSQELAAKARQDYVTAYRISAALAWLTCDDAIISQCYSAYPPDYITPSSLFTWAVGVAKLLAASSQALANQLQSISIPGAQDFSNLSITIENSGGRRGTDREPSATDSRRDRAEGESGSLHANQEGPSLESEISGSPA